MDKDKQYKERISKMQACHRHNVDRMIHNSLNSKGLPSEKTVAHVINTYHKGGIKEGRGALSEVPKPPRGPGLT